MVCDGGGGGGATASAEASECSVNVGWCWPSSTCAMNERGGSWCCRAISRSKRLTTSSAACAPDHVSLALRPRNRLGLAALQR
jgi:hypothetical protein